MQDDYEGDDFASGGDSFASAGEDFTSGGDLSRFRSTEVQDLMIRSARRLLRGTTLPVEAKTSPVEAIRSPPLAKFFLSTYTRRQRPLLELNLC
ncbi:hypothetical protein R1flu_008072 [Riccia fluitans]|uniref:Uncharacterized protein n=1 Tax=Riccia fluitans TaxID=41844 RepID=A0ABD1YDR4_9MARC